VQLAHLELAQGRWRSAQQELEKATALDLPYALEYRAIFSALPFRQTAKDELESVRDELLRWDAGAVPESGMLLDPHLDAHLILRTYLLGVVSSKLENIDEARGYAEELARSTGSEDEQSVPTGFSATIDALIKVAQDHPEEAAKLIEGARFRRFDWARTHVSAFYSRAFERFVLAGLFAVLGQSEEALRWYDTAGKQSLYDLVYLAPSNLKSAQICEQLGRTEEAMAHYRRFIDLWQDCDEEFRPQLEEAERALARLENSS
jgi:tetratricopeptide (TPR) repeat protein